MEEEAKYFQSEDIMKVATLKALVELDEKAGESNKGWYFIQIYQELLKNFSQMPKEIQEQQLFGTFIANKHLTASIKEGKVYFNDEVTKFSSKKLEGFRNLQERLSDQFPGYIFDDQNKLQAKTAQTLNFQEVKHLLFTLVSHLDQNKVDYFEKALSLNGGSCFLDDTIDVEKIQLASTLKSGSTFCRKLLSQIIGIEIGTVFANDNTVDFQTQFHGLKGEGHKGNQTILVKTHLPIASEKREEPLNAIKSIYIVRNPIDMFISSLQFFLVFSNTVTLKNDFKTEFAENYSKYIELSCIAQKNYYDFWYDTASKAKHPILFVRYEDLMNSKEQTLQQIVEFIFGQSIEGTYLSQRIKKVVSDSNSGKTYNPRNAGKSSNLKHYTKEHIETMKKTIRNFLIFFGYHKCELNPDSVFDLGELSESEKELEFGYLKTNQKSYELLKIDQSTLEPINIHNFEYQGVLPALPFLMNQEEILRYEVLEA